MGDRNLILRPLHPFWWVNFFQVTMDPQWQQKIEQDIKEAQETALPEDDEDL